MKNGKKGKISYLQPDWSGRNIEAGFSTRNGGVSRPPYNSLNLGFGTDDPKHNVEANRTALTRAFGLDPNLLLTVRQVHGTDILIVDDENPDLSHFQKVESDAIITDQPGIMIGILVADCYPVLIHDPVRQVAAAIHAGWRGAAAGLIGLTIKAMQSHFSCIPADMMVAIGPGIGAHKYLVDRPVRDAFRDGSGFWEAISSESSLGQWQLDIGQSCRIQLEAAGIIGANIDVVRECTCCHRELFFSHRRDQGVTGRQLGFVMLT
ncbi:MAG: peptidoglycan editing factor PgeF [Desulfuromonas sp.]|nr:MAG: peptidoglycan editing factor PgeF [Desulfuromonas sp.]